MEQIIVVLAVCLTLATIIVAFLLCDLAEARSRNALTLEMTKLGFRQDETGAWKKLGRAG